MTAHNGDREYATVRDRDDPLADFRRRFAIPLTETGREKIYFCGNSLGLQPKTARSAVEVILRDWEERAVDAHFRGAEPWLTYHETVNAMMAEMAGAFPGEVVLMNALSVNLHLLLFSMYRPAGERCGIAVEAGPFPSDLYALYSHFALHGIDPAHGLITITPRPGESILRTEDVMTFLSREGERIAVLLLGGINFVSGQFFEIAPIVRAAHASGILVGLDLAHAVGNVPLHLHDWDVDFAVWCSYKYLNAGPGSPGGCFVHERFRDRTDLPRLAGWWGESAEQRFRMQREFLPAPGARGWQISNPSLLALAPLRASLELFREAGADRLRAKSLQLTAHLYDLLAHLDPVHVHCVTPADPEQRGAQLTYRVHQNGRAVFEGLLAAGVVCDWREPGAIRLAPVPLYNTFEEVQACAQVFEALLRTNA